MTEPHVIRTLGAADVAIYRERMLEAYSREPDAFISTAEERALEPESWWLQRIADPAGLGAAFGAFAGDRLIGTTAVRFSERQKVRHKATLLGVYVQERHRNDGLGRQLVSKALEAVRARPHVRVVTLTVTESNEPALRLYEGVGFRRFGVEPMAIATPTGLASKVHMALELSPTTPS